MSSERAAKGDVAIAVRDLSKCYQIYGQPKDRLKQSIYPIFQRFAGLQAKKYHHDFWALRNVSFEVRRGETVGIVGKNGSGKSTLLHLIVGTLAPTAGSIEISGRVTALLELGSGFNPQFTGRENVMLNAAIWGLTREETERRFDEIASFADIGEFMEQPVGTYSSGMAVRLAFAVQVCLDPDILVIDEALAVGDAYFVHRCFHRIRRMKDEGKTILFVSHDTASVNNLCDRAIWINGGRLQLEGHPDEITARYRADLFGLSMSEERDEQEPSPQVAAPAPAEAARGTEQSIPNVDLRMGRKRCHIQGIGLYDASGAQAIAEIDAGGEVVLRTTIVNTDLEPGTRLIYGYMVCTPRGEELGGLNTTMSPFKFAAPARGESATIRARVKLPDLHPAHYALTVAIASESSDGRIDVEDRVENALVFQVLNSREVVGWMRFPTTFEVE